MELNLQGSYALITGGSKGIGYAVAEVFAREGVHLILAARTSNELEQAKNQLQHHYRVSVETVATDLSDSQAISELVEKTSHVDSNLPLHRAATPEEVANLVVFLASAKASYINGVV